jgi:CoA:oxalate CoA-transferase
VIRVVPRKRCTRLRRQNLTDLLAEVRAWILTFSTIEQLQAQVSEAGLAVGEIHTLNEFAKSDWVKEWNAIVEVDDRNGGATPMPGNPWIFSGSTLPPPGVPAFQGEHNHEILTEIDVPEKVIKDLQQRGILLSRSSIMGAYD